MKLERSEMTAGTQQKAPAKRRVGWGHHLAIMVVLIGMTLSGTSRAQDGWSFTAGAGVYGENVYFGSGEYYLTPLPTFKATYTRGGVSCSISLLEGLNLTYVDQSRGFISSLEVNAGNRRNCDSYSVAGFDINHSDKTQALLAGTPDVFTELYLKAMFAYPTPVGVMGVSAGYHPTKVEHRQETTPDATKHGFLYSVFYLVQRPVGNRLVLLGMSSLEFMDQTYADTWYSLDEETEALETFRAGAGLRDAVLACQLQYIASARLNTSLVYEGTLLLGDASASPYTVERLQHTFGIETTYSF